MFSNRFINVLDDFGAPLSDLGVALQRASEGLVSAGLSGAVVFYIARPCALSWRIRMPSRILFEFAPGAVVTLSPGAELVIEGGVSLSIRRHFVLREGARVLLLGPIPGVRPEWFAALEDRADEALDVAYEIVRERAAVGAPSVPLLLSGSYRLTRSWRLRAPGTGSLEVVLSGRHPVGDAVTPPTLWADGDFTQPSLIHVERGVTLRMSRLALRSDDAEAMAGGSLLVLEGDNDGTQIERCTFFCHNTSAVTARALLPSRDERLAFRSSWFESTAAGVEAPLLDVRVGRDGSRVTIDGCNFLGPARAMAAVVSGMVEVSDCQFANLDPAGPDLLIGAQSSLDRGGESALSVDFVETHARSESSIHIQGNSAEGVAAAAVSVTGLCHVPSAGPSKDRPAMRWTGAIEGGLLVQGSTLGGSVVVTPQDTRVILLATRLRGGATVEGTRVEAVPPPWLR